MGFFTGLNQEAYDRTYTDLELIRRIGRYFAQHRKRMWGIIIFVTVVSIAGAGQPLIVAQAVEILGTTPSTGQIVTLFVLMTLFGIGVWGANWIRRRLTARLIADVVARLRHDAFASVINHDMAFFDEYASGRIISRITTDTNEFIQTVQLITDIVSQVLLVFILLFFLLYISIPLNPGAVSLYTHYHYLHPSLSSYCPLCNAKGVSCPR